MLSSPTARHLARLGAVGLVGLVALTGCRVDPLAGFRQREAVVVFKPNTSENVRLKVRADCSSLPNATPEPVQTDSKLKSTRVYGVRYRIDDATDQDLIKLYGCLRKHDSVLGVKIPENM